MLILYDNDDHLAPETAERLVAKGYTNVTVLTGGLRAVALAGEPVSLLVDGELPVDARPPPTPSPPRKPSGLGRHSGAATVVAASLLDAFSAAGGGAGGGGGSVAYGDGGLSPRSTRAASDRASMSSATVASISRRLGAGVGPGGGGGGGGGGMGTSARRAPALASIPDEERAEGGTARGIAGPSSARAGVGPRSGGAGLAGGVTHLEGPGPRAGTRAATMATAATAARGVRAPAR